MASYEKISKAEYKKLKAKIKKMNDQGEHSLEIGAIVGRDQVLVDKILGELN